MVTNDLQEFQGIGHPRNDTRDRSTSVPEDTQTGNTEVYRDKIFQWSV